MFNLRHAPGRFFAAPIAGAALFAALPAAAEDAHGVIAFGETAQGEGVAYGFSWNFDGKDAAHAEAVNACISSGGTDCVQLAWFQNGCGALAMDQYGNAQGKPGMSLDQAEARALRTCEAVGGGGCNIVGSVCAAPGGEPGTWSGSESVVPAHGSQTTVTGPEDEPLTREERIRVQQSLTVLGFDVGPADGVFGRRTRSAIWEWQNANGLEATGYVTRGLAESLMAVGASSREEPKLPQKAIENRSGSQAIASRQRTPKCQGMEVGAFCWKEISNKPGCFLMTYDFHLIVKWSGGCLDDTAHGRGTLVWRNSKLSPASLDDMEVLWPWILSDEADSIDSTGEIVQGKMEGRWVHRFPSSKYYDESKSEGEYVAGKLNGWYVEWDLVESGQWFPGVLRYAVDGEGVQSPGRHAYPDWIARWEDAD